MSGLNPAQKKAVNTLRGPLLVLAGAGSGKTRVITFRIARLIKAGIAPQRILGVTFTNKAATEMQERLAQMLGKRKERPVISTFHSHCVRILRRHIEQLGYPARFAIYSRGDQESVARSVLREIRVPDKMVSSTQLLFMISNWKSRGWSPDKAALEAETDQEHVGAIAFRRYQNELKLKGAVDFDDLLILTERLLTSNEDIRQSEANLFDHILVDEYQDTNQSQYRIVSALARDHRNLCVVGDDDQSIYGWRGAEVEHILNFKKDWPDAVVVQLEDNYRCSGAILQMANSLIRFNSVRHDKQLRAAKGMGERPRILQFPNEEKEATEIVFEIQRRLEQNHRQPRDFAILFRTNEQPRPFETALRKARLPYILVGGMSFFDRKEVKDLLAYFRLIGDQPDEVSILRIINTPARGIGKKAQELLLDHAISQKKQMWELVCTGGEGVPLTAPARKGLHKLADLVQSARHQEGTLVDQARRFVGALGYREELERLYDDADERDSRWNTVEQVINALAEYEASARQPSWTEFLDRLVIGDQQIEDEKEKQLKRNAIVLMTLHSAKGLEFPEVYMVGMEEGVLPHHRSMADERNVEEERRLCYVGVTRAQERLTLSLPLTRRKWGKPRDTIPSRFLYEMTGQAENPTYLKQVSRTRGA